jgi:hypothetical protein
MYLNNFSSAMTTDISTDATFDEFLQADLSCHYGHNVNQLIFHYN